MNKFVLLLFLMSLTLVNPARESRATIGQQSDDRTTQFKQDLDKLYKMSDNKLFWHDSDNLNSSKIDRTNEAVKESAYKNGLIPEDYILTNIVDFSKSNRDNDLALTATIMGFLQDLQLGRVSLDDYDKMFFLLSEQKNLVELTYEVLTKNDPEAIFKKSEPSHKNYQELKDKLADYRAFLESDLFSPLPDEQLEIIYPGEHSDLVPHVRKRLSSDVLEYDSKLAPRTWIDKAQMLQDSDVKLGNKTMIIEHDESHSKQARDITNKDKTKSQEKLYDAQLAERVAEFQFLNGIKVDGVIGPVTIRTMNIKPEDRIEQIKLAMERWRWVPNRLGEKYIVLNIAGFYVRGVENDETAFFMPAIVGQRAHQTPVFSSVIKNVKMHPDWTAPSSIARRYLISKIQDDPKAIDRLGYQIQNKQTGDIVPWTNVNIQYLDQIDLSRYQFRQKPGPLNALGLARFSIENDYSIFMHGTPSTSLFNKEERMFSSGCIRLKDPLKMAKFLLKNQKSDAEIEALYHIEKGEDVQTKYLPLKKEIPVYLMYQTAWINKGGGLHFAKDIYKRDKELAQFMEL